MSQSLEPVAGADGAAPAAAAAARTGTGEDLLVRGEWALGQANLKSHAEA